MDTSFIGVCRIQVASLGRDLSHEVGGQTDLVAPQLQAPVSKETSGLRAQMFRGRAQVNERLFDDSHDQSRLRTHDSDMAK
ncbi:hypothetical protein C1I89_33845 [Achromobacter pulmonis]|jgi:hypothetical protein|uniref:Uncharacterized protein n=1 Tax=Achromobacter pulmonis TaxID=1389932 RepID=A0A2N8K828_9BURK|nr:hypothetical protein C1I89_33845 [Achromobacter pulmonis]